MKSYIIAAIQDEIIFFFELKDRMFSLGDAYPFIARVQRYGATTGVILSTDGVAKEVQRFLREQSGARNKDFYAISSEDDIRTMIPKISNERAKLSATYGLREAFEPVGVDRTPILNAWFEKRIF